MILTLALVLCTAATVAILGRAFADVMRRAPVGRVRPMRHHRV